MNPIAFTLFGIEVRWYGLLIATGMFLAAALLLQLGKRKGYAENDLLDLVLWVIPSAIVGARLYYVLFNLSYYDGDLMAMLNIRSGGLAIHGGVIAGVVVGYFFCKKRKLNFWEIADFVAPGLILAQAIGRWGNYANGEAHGGPTDLPWAIVVDGVAVHPTFLYESLWNLLVFGVLMFTLRKRAFNGQLAALYLILYSIGRFFIEGLRTDSLMLGPIRVAQLISILMIGLGVYLYQHRKKQ